MHYDASVIWNSFMNQNIFIDLENLLKNMILYGFIFNKFTQKVDKIVWKMIA